MRRTFAVGTSLVVGALLLLITAPPGLGGDAGTQSPFSLGAGARDLALGGAVVTSADAATAVYWNPALLAQAERISVAGFYTGLYGSAAAYQYLGAAVPTMDVGGFGIGVFRLGVDGIERRDAGNLYLGEFGDSRLAVYAGFGRAFAAYDLGVAISLEHQACEDKSATSSPGLDLAAVRRIRTGLGWLPQASVGVNARNVIEPSLKLEKESVRHPRAVDAGIAIDLAPGESPDHVVTVSAAVAAVSELDPSFAFGLEYALKDLLALRAGLRDGDACFGAGLRYRAIAIDYALVDRDLGSVHTFSICAGLGMPVSEKRRVREEAREAQFNQLLEGRLAVQNLEAVTNLVNEGKRLMGEGQLARASVVADRALLLAGEGGAEGAEEGGGENGSVAGLGDRADSTGVLAQARSLRAALDAELAKLAFAAHLDSAEAKMTAKDFLGARYFAELALAKDPNSDVARGLLAQADQAIDQGAAESLVLESRLRMADSLVSYSQYEKALTVVRGLGEGALGDGRVIVVTRKAEFGYWQDVARTAFTRGDYIRARAAVDSALARFPDQPACVSLRAQIDREMQARKPAPATVAAPRPVQPGPVDDAVRKDVEGFYQRGQTLFEKGRLADAVAEWEKVELLAPGYQSVRTYLVNAYKYLGVELYTQNDLQEAIDVWRKAAKLAPDNTEIGNYIRRAEGEMARLRELSYERR
jgi:tetratricopeptide (TPR) repeat protein